MTELEKLEEKITDYKRMIELMNLIKDENNDDTLDEYDNELSKLMGKYNEIDYYDDIDILKDRLDKLEREYQPYKVTIPLFKNKKGVVKMGFFDDIFQDKSIEIDKVTDKRIKSGLYKMDMKNKYLYLFIRKRKTPIKLKATHLIANKFNNIDWDYFDEYITLNYDLETGNKYRDKKYDKPQEVAKKIENEKPKMKKDTYGIYEHDCIASAKYHLGKYKHWAKKITNIDDTKKGGYAFVGEWLKVKEQHKLPVNTFVIEFKGCEQGGLYTLYKITEKGKTKIIDATRTNFYELIDKAKELINNKKTVKTTENKDIERDRREKQGVKKALGNKKKKRDENSGKIKSLDKIIEDAFHASKHKTLPLYFSEYEQQVVYDMKNGIIAKTIDIFKKFENYSNKTEIKMNIKWGISVIVEKQYIDKKYVLHNDDEFYLWYIKTPRDTFVYTKFINLNLKSNVNNIELINYTDFLLLLTNISLRKAPYKTLVFDSKISRYTSNELIDTLINTKP